MGQKSKTIFVDSDSRTSSLRDIRREAEAKTFSSPSSPGKSYKELVPVRRVNLNSMLQTAGMKTFFPRIHVLFVLSYLLAAPNLWAQIVDDFNDDNDAGWTRYDPIGSHPQVPDQAIYTLINGTYRIQVPASPNEAFGPARAGSVRTDVSYTNFFVSVDLIDWNENVDQAFGIIARVQDPGLGTTDGYAMTFDFGGGDIDITWFTNEDPNTPNGGGVGSGVDDLVPMTKGRVYRFQFIGKGSLLTARVYELPDTHNPVAAISGTDTHWESGYAGLLIYDNSGGTGIADATFDNYFALDYEPPRPKLEILTFDDYMVSWPVEFSDFVLESTESLTNPNWTPIVDIQQNDTIRYYIGGNVIEGNKFFRLVPQSSR